MHLCYFLFFFLLSRQKRDVDLPEIIPSARSLATFSPKTFALDVVLEEPRYEEEVLLSSWWPLALGGEHGTYAALYINVNISFLCVWRHPIKV